MVAKPCPRALARDIVQEFFAELAPLCTAALDRRANDNAPPREARQLKTPQPEVSSHSTEAFWSRVDRTGPNACWEWRGAWDKGGYGRFNYHGRYTMAHRFAYEIANGPIPPGLCVLHSCDNRRCQNPRHLSLGTVRDNVEDMVRKRRHQHCEKHGTAKLTNEAVRAIRKSAEPIPTLAKRYGVSPAAIRNALNGRSWLLLDAED